MAVSRWITRRAWWRLARACSCPVRRSSTRPIAAPPSLASAARPRRAERSVAAGLLAASLAFAGSACAHRPEPSAPPLDTAALDAWLRPSTRPRADSQSSRDALAAADLDSLLELVARRRGLAFRERPELDAVPRGELVERGLRWIETQTPREQRAAETELLVRLELVPADFAWQAALRALLARQLKAFYDPSTRRIVMDRALPAGVRRRVLAHELVHALVDQHFEIGARLAAPGSADRRAALLTLAEGDAEMLVEQLGGAEPDGAALGDELAVGGDALRESETALPESGTASLEEEPDGEPSRPGEPASPDGEPGLPGVLARSLSAAYVDGRGVVQRLLHRGGFAAVDALYRKPPAGTYQLLAAHFPLVVPDAVPALLDPTPPNPSLPGTTLPGSTLPGSTLPGSTRPDPGWALRHSDVLGAQTWRTVLEEWLPPERAAELARGWDGDRLGWFERAGQRLLVWEVRSDAEHAAPLAQAVSRALGLATAERDSRSDARRDRPTARATGFSCRAQRDGGVMGRWIHGRSLILAALSGAARSAQCDLLAAWTIPAPRRQKPSRDLGPHRLIGPT
jgi:hypothetical protein